MKGFVLTEQVAKLHAAHRATKEKRVAYKINAVILLGTVWKLEQVSQALLLNEEILRTYVSRYKQGGVKKLIKSLLGGRFFILTDDEKTWLSEYVQKSDNAILPIFRSISSQTKKHANWQLHNSTA